jgi:CO/xanthine dehydrogenase FAD-binding subunit
MVAAPFGYQRVSSFDEAVQALHERGEDAKVIAGGQSLVPMLNLRVARPEWLIDINPVGAGPIEEHGGSLRLPALTRHRAIEESEVVRRRCPILAEAAIACLTEEITLTVGTPDSSLMREHSSAS